MADKQYDFSDFDEDVTPKKEDASSYDFSDFDEINQPSMKEDTMDIAQGAASGATFGLSDIIQGAAIPAVAGISDLVSGDAASKNKLEEDVLAKEAAYNLKRQEKGLQPEQVVDQKSLLKGLLDKYYSAKDIANESRESAAERSPGLYTAGAMAGSIPSAMAGTGLAASSKLASTFLPNLKTGMTAKDVIMQGGKAGALAGIGEGDSRLLEGDVAGTIAETAKGAGIGAATGLGIKGAMGVGSLAGKLLPKQKWGTAYNYGKDQGKELDSRNVLGDAEKFSEDLIGTLKSKYKATGEDMRSIQAAADKAGVSLNAGKSIQETLASLDEVPARGDVAKKAISDIKQELISMMGVSKPEQKLIQAAQRDVVKSELKGSPLTDQIEKQEGYLTSKLSTPTGDVKKVGAVKMNTPEVGATNLTPAESSALVNEVRDLAMGTENTQAKSILSTLAKNLDKESKDIIDAYSGGAYSKAKQQSSDLVGGTKIMGLEKEDLWNAPIEDYRDAVTKLTTRTTKDSDVDILKKQDFYKQLEKAGVENVPSLKARAQELEDLRMMAGLSDSDQSLLSKTGLFRISGKAANIAGLASKGMADTYKSVQDSMIKPETVQAIVAKINSIPGADKFKNALNAISTTDSASKRAAMTYGLMQNPAFRQLFDEVINENSNVEGSGNENSQL